ncbi:MAG: SDR family NAD(P)-dependent oxidoreductase [Woeseiaceae bacterium]|nr:SDR family NAD(P)-dependent oxidoreductase [Woeseiaceae bacterium]
MATSSAQPPFIGRGEQDMRERPVVLITGGASGIGRAIADSYLELGHRVHVCDADPDAVAACRESMQGATASVADISSADDVAALFDDVKRTQGGLDVLNNAVGIGVDGAGREHRPR